jgi:hypothetical protein
MEPTIGPLVLSLTRQRKDVRREVGGIVDDERTVAALG